MTRNAAAFDPALDDVFSRIASRYDRLCDVFSLMQHRRWKSAMAEHIHRNAHGVVLDVASGTGDIPARLVRRLSATPEPSRIERIIVSDLCPVMLDVARMKIDDAPVSVDVRILDAHDLTPIPDGSIDTYSISFGMKICDRDRLLAEAFRVLRPGGSLCCLEAARIPFEPLHQAYLAYMNWCLPIMARLATGGDRSAYDYLLKGLNDFPAPRAFASELEDRGFIDVRFRAMSFGIVAFHWARRPEA